MAWNGVRPSSTLTMMSLRCISEPGQKKHQIWYNSHHIQMASDTIFKYDSAGRQKRSLTSSMLHNNYYWSYETLQNEFLMSCFGSIYTFSPSIFLLDSPIFVSFSLHTVGPVFNSQGGQLALHLTHPRTKGKLQIAAVRAATRGTAQQDSSCLWLALITDWETHRALETSVGTKKIENGLWQKKHRVII